MTDVLISPKGLEQFCLVSRNGEIYSKARIKARKNGGTYRTSQRKLAEKTTKNGYKAVSFWVNDTRKTFLSHRLIALAFLPEVDGKPLINHKNGIKDDNRVENLEWCNKSENASHAYRILGSSKGGRGRLGELNTLSLPISSVDIKTGETKFFEGLMDAQRKGFNASCISECLHGTQKTHRGMKWFKTEGNMK
jgi:hypothetical protein